MLNLLYILHLHFHAIWYDAPRALYAGFVTRSLAANDETKMAALGGIAEIYQKIDSSFFERTKALLGVFLSAEHIE